MTGEVEGGTERGSGADVMTASPAAQNAKGGAGEPSDLEKIKAAQASRRTRRTRSTAVPLTPDSTAPGVDKAEPTATSDDSPIPRRDHEAALAAVREEMATMRLEMGSLRRNHLHNLKKVTEERDMFASQLVREQSAAKRAPSTGETRKVADMEVQLRAARTRNTDLEAENGVLRDEVKQLNFRVQASKTIDAATNGYERIVDDLVVVKLKCAQLQEEKEDLLRINKELSQTAAMLTDANGELEKSRTHWVVQCADLEKKRAELEAKVMETRPGQSSEEKEAKGATNPDTSYTGSDLQELKLN